MNQKENKELELLVKNLFLQSKKASKVPAKSRIRSILQRSLHELALRDFLILSSNTIFAMITMLSLFLKLFTSKTLDTDSKLQRTFSKWIKMQFLI